MAELSKRLSTLGGILKSADTTNHEAMAEELLKINLKAVLPAEEFD